MSEDRVQIYQLATTPVCAGYRFDYARQHLNAGNKLRVTRFNRFTEQNYQSILHSADILIVQRAEMSERFAAICSAFNDRGKLVVYDIDDDLLHVHPDSAWGKVVSPEEISQRIKPSILACQAVQCSTATLAHVISEFHPEVAVLENQLDAVIPYLERRQDVPIIVGYAAGSNHYIDWLTIRDAYNRAIGQLEADGYDVQTWVIEDEAIFDSINSSNKRYFPILHRDQYLQFLQDIHISLIPLADIRFNHSKSDVKFLESAVCGAAALASDVVYSASVKHGETGILFRNAEEFVAGLTAFVKSPGYIQRLSRNAHDWVATNRLIEQHVSKWEATYLGWYHNRADLLQA